MNKNDEQLIQYFMQSNKHEIADNGFSRRVMQRLPISAKTWSNILTVICVVCSCILFHLYHGTTVLFQSIREVFHSQITGIMNQTDNFLTLLIVLASITLVCIRSAWAIKE